MFSDETEMNLLQILLWRGRKGQSLELVEREEKLKANACSHCCVDCSHLAIHASLEHFHNIMTYLPFLLIVGLNHSGSFPAPKLG